ncbi:MAG TPA: hypothetical protein VFF36_16215, partial [Planctomycetota bacterium]|nr:hypothetical protein [Planctomycetota bacterium]
MPDARRRERGASRLETALLLVACAALSTSALVAVLLARGSVPVAAALALALALGTLANAAAFVLLLRRWRAAPPAWRPRLPVRGAVYLMLGAAAAYLIWLQPYRSLVAHVVFGLAAGVAGLAALCAGPLLARLPPRLVSTADLIVFAACLLALGGELGLRVIAAHSRSPLFARSDEPMLDFMARYRLRPEQASPGFPVNSGGHFDAEFGARTPGVPRAVTIGDSFSTSVVPHRYHFTTVAERVLGRGEVCNVGIAGMGLNEYLSMLREDALPLQPDVVVVDVYIGNDLVGSLGGRISQGGLAHWLNRDQLLILLVPWRLWRTGEQQGGMRLASAPGAEPAPAAGEALDLDGPELERLYPWLSDPTRELPTVSTEAFDSLEQQRAQSVCRADAPPDWPRIFELLLEMRRTAGSTPFAVMLIPEEFQVEDDVWALVAAGADSDALDRDLPQRLLGQWLAKQDIPCLDLLPALRAVPPMADGRR